MSLSNLLLMLKGGGKSGHWAHDGDPPNQGGSSPGGGFTKIGAKPDMSKQQIQQLSQEKRQKVEKSPSALEVGETLKGDKKATFQSGNWKAGEGRRNKGTWTTKVGDTNYTISASSSTNYSKVGRLRDANKTSQRVSIEISSKKDSDTSFGGGSYKVLFDKTAKGEGGETREKIAKAQQDAIKYMKDRFGIEMGEYDFRF